jgi:hypothetical protein
MDRGGREWGREGGAGPGTFGNSIQSSEELKLISYCTQILRYRVRYLHCVVPVTGTLYRYKVQVRSTVSR